MFDSTSLGLVEDLFRGKDALLFAFGCTNSGKSHTIQGTKHNPGIIPRVLGRLFELAADAEDCAVDVSFFEVYNDSIYDLLATDKGVSANTH